MVNTLLQKSLNVFLRRQTNILSAAFVIMTTVVLSQVLGLVRDRLLFSIFGPSNILGVYNYASILPDTIFQLVIAAALSSAFIPVFSDYLAKNREKEGHKMASTLLTIGLTLFAIVSLVLAVFAEQFLVIFNLGSQFSPEQMHLMANIMRIIIAGQLLFIIGTFFTALLQSYDHFFIPGLAAASYNLGIIIGILSLHSYVGIYAAPLGVFLGAIIFILVQLPLAKKVGFAFTPTLAYLRDNGIKKIMQLMWPRTIQTGVFQIGTVVVAMIIALMADPGRMKVLFDAAKTLAFAPVSLVGLSIAQAAFPVLSREKDKIHDFKATFMTSFNQMLYLILPISALILVLRIPIVRLIYGADAFDWDATVLTGRTLAFLSLSIFAQALVNLVYRAFYALHNTKTPLIVGAISTTIIIISSYMLVVVYKFGLESVALAFTIGSIIQLLLLLFLLDKRIGGFDRHAVMISMTKFFFTTLLTGFALYIPIKLLDQLVFDTTRTVNLIILTGISSLIGLFLYLFLTWLFNVHEAVTYILMFKKLGNWQEILGKSDEVIEGNRINP